MRFSILVLLALCVTYSSCQSGRATSARMPEDNATVKKAAAANIDLTEYINQLPGVTVRGTGGTAKITVRGSVSILGNSSPLFIVNGVSLGFDYSSVYSVIDRTEIKSVQVLRRPEEVGLYGVRGGNGVIKIQLKD